MACSAVTCFRWMIFLCVVFTEITGRHLHKSSAETEHNVVETDNIATQTTSSVLLNNTSRKDEKDSDYSSFGCCERKSKSIAVGYDVSGTQIELDIGECRRTCGPHSHGRLNRKESAQNVSWDRERSYHSCPRDLSCEPTRLKREKVHLVGDPVEYDVIENCACKPVPVVCRRRSQLVVLYPDSPHQTQIDVGSCEGHCSDGEGTVCRSTKNQTITVEGPNGKECVEIIDECSCESECYRVPYMQSYYEIVYDSVVNRTVQQHKEIDIGRCVGTCSTTNHLRCVMRSPSDPNVCLMSLVKKNVSCLPKTYTTHQFVSRGGVVKTVLAVNECSCK
ncbi:pinhead-like protein precursor [Saccoglossus kowalevskii]|uniref:Pinhead-like protein n=1 Tax=Saccoglossus kowalevskii TaxID=10224 RepID=D1LXB4_SACKO|nr:pinhead-like protein precursor [Saccoglossus kowalevskii]ACY92620.1 pinhead-like protein [Saccoglossus kowalevskii]